jgi:hypothetical protein
VPARTGLPLSSSKVVGGAIKDNFVLAFAKLHALNWHGFQVLNQALITLLPKRYNASFLGNYRPINHIHIFAKLMAKVLASRLAPRLSALVKPNNCAFIQKCCIQDNFMLVQWTARLLHRLKEPQVILKLDITRVFDSVSWAMLFEVLRKVRFGPKF